MHVDARGVRTVVNMDFVDVIHQPRPDQSAVVRDVINVDVRRDVFRTDTLVKPEDRIITENMPPRVFFQ
ncbi:hypothetical protein G6F55_014495 [Rhizopus delemar]|nr:hypothetical protein G6F55_014495 [Rhizopus delemar]